MARQASAYSLWNCTCGKIGSCKVELHMWENCDSPLVDECLTNEKLVNSILRLIYSVSILS